MDNQVRLKRLHYRSWHRGCKETDIVLGHFADEQLYTLDAALLDIYEQLLDEDDVVIWDWLTGKNEPLPKYEPLLKLLQNRVTGG